MSEKTTEEQIDEERVERIWGRYGKRWICECPKCSHGSPRILGQKCGTCPDCGTQMNSA